MVKLNMPEKEEDKTSNTPQPESNPLPEMPVRETTQTDHINKKLLTSLFNRMNEGGDTMLSKMLEPENDSEDNDEWK